MLCPVLLLLLLLLGAPSPPRTTVTVKGDVLYKEGFYDYDDLPGGYLHLGDPNIPFSTDTNRYSDGYTSTDAFETSSPRFPVYHSASADVEGRYLHYLDYINSAAEQGISPYGAGDEQREAARLKVAFQPGPAPSKNFTVYSSIKWNPSDFAIQEGEIYTVEVLGFEKQFWYDGGLKVNAEGYSSYFDGVSNCYVGLGRCRSHLKKKRRVPTANWMSLACAIGEFVRPLVEIEPGKEQEYRWMPLDESALQETIFDVGQRFQFRSKYTGQLICFANDAHTLYWNNNGNIQATVTRASWPPSTIAVYQSALLPACDSARVVYTNKGDNTPDKGKIECNPSGGGAGWSLEDVLNTKGGYGSGAPESIFYDLPESVRNQ